VGLASSARVVDAALSAQRILTAPDAVFAVRRLEEAVVARDADVEMPNKARLILTGLRASGTYQVPARKACQTDLFARAVGAWRNAIVATPIITELAIRTVVASALLAEDGAVVVLCSALDTVARIKRAAVDGDGQRLAAIPVGAGLADRVDSAMAVRVVDADAVAVEVEAVVARQAERRARARAAPKVARHAVKVAKEEASVARLAIALVPRPHRAIAQADRVARHADAVDRHKRAVAQNAVALLVVVHLAVRVAALAALPVAELEPKCAHLADANVGLSQLAPDQARTGIACRAVEPEV